MAGARLDLCTCPPGTCKLADVIAQGPVAEGSPIWKLDELQVEVGVITGIGPVWWSIKNGETYLEWQDGSTINRVRCLHR